MNRAFYDLHFVSNVYKTGSYQKLFAWWLFDRLFWKPSVNCFAVGIRTMPHESREETFLRGLIHFAPGKKGL
jgi:hypothetical protein